uniref:Osm-1 protein n=1 Tax=Fopius arisanus TaxID=64838 RepID=A0A0C9RB93_9HYME
MEEKINHLGGTSDSHAQKKRQARRESKVEEGSDNSEVRKFTRWTDGMTGIKDNSSHSSKFNQKDLTLRITNYIFRNQSGDFSVESQSRCSSLTKDIKTSTLRKKLQRKRHLSDDQYLLGQRSSSFLSSSFIVDLAWNNISPIALKKAKKDSCETVVSYSTDGKTKRGSVGETVQGKQPLSPKNLNQEEQNSCKVSAISAGSVDVNRNISQPALTSNVVNNGNKENSSLIQGL